MTNSPQPPSFLHSPVHNMSGIDNQKPPSVKKIMGRHESIALAHKLQQEEYKSKDAQMQQLSERRKVVKTAKPNGCPLCLKYEGKSVIHSTSEVCAWSDLL